MVGAEMDKETRDLAPAASAIPLTMALTGAPYRVIAVASPLSGKSKGWQRERLRLSELGIFFGQVIEKVGSTGPGCPTILKVGGSRAALSAELCDLIIVRRVSKIARRDAPTGALRSPQC